LLFLQFSGVGMNGEVLDSLIVEPSSSIPRQSVEPELRFLRAKVKILTSEIDKQREDQKKKVCLKINVSNLHFLKLKILSPTT
jgi:hypothetical protein